jgi:hypothetical protein
MIVNAYAEGDRRTLKNLLAREVYDGFESAINEREKRGETVESRFVSIDHVVAEELHQRVIGVVRQSDRRAIGADVPQFGSDAGRRVELDPEARAALKKAGLLTRDPTDATYGAKWGPPPTPPLLVPYTPYTTIWAGSGGAPAIGNGSLVATYWRHSQTIFFAIKLTIGTTTNLGAGAWSFTVPVPAESNSSIGMACYGAAVRTSAGSQPFPIMGALLVAGGNTSFWIWNLLFTAGQNVVTPASPFAWAATDYLHLTGSYYAATGSEILRDRLADRLDHVEPADGVAIAKPEGG